MFLFSLLILLIKGKSIFIAQLYLFLYFIVKIGYFVPLYVFKIELLQKQRQNLEIALYIE